MIGPARANKMLDPRATPPHSGVNWVVSKRIFRNTCGCSYGGIDAGWLFSINKVLQFAAARPLVESPLRCAASAKFRGVSTE